MMYLAPPARLALLPAILVCFTACEPTRVVVENTPPEAAILVPETGADLWEGRSITLRGQTGDRLSDLTTLTASWSSSRDGQLFEGAPDADGVTEFEATSLSVGAHEIALRVVDPDGASAIDTVEIVVQDDLPPAVEILEPDEGDAPLPPDLPFAFVARAEDAEDAPTDLRVSVRTEDGEVLAEDLVPTSDGETTASLLLEPGTWTLVAELRDTLGQTAQDTLVLTVLPRDEAPVISSVEILPSELRVGTEATCTYSGFEALPGAEDLSTFAWTISGEEAGTDAVLRGGFVGGDLLRCTVTPRTATLSGAPLSAEVRVANSPPLISSLSLVPEAPATNDLLQATATASDPDGETVTLAWAWEVNGVDIGVSESTLDGRTSFERGDTVRVTATPSDAAEAGPGATAEVTIQNTAPTPASAHIEPALPARLDDLTCVIDTPGADLDAADVLSTEITWTRDGSPTAYTGDTLPASATSDGEAWRCDLTVSDGTASAASSSPEVLISSIRSVCAMEVDAALDEALDCTADVPVDGLLRIEMTNPDGSADGVFRIDLGTLGVHWLFTGFRDWAYGGTVVTGWESATMEVPLGAGDGPVSIGLTYESEYASTPGGADLLELSFVYYEGLDTSDATLLSESLVGPTDTTPTDVSASLTEGESLLIELTSCGFGGGGHGLYAENDGLTGNDGFLRVDTGWGASCNTPLRRITLPPGDYLFSMVQEDDLLSDNSEDRGVRLYRTAP